MSIIKPGAAPRSSTLEVARRATVEPARKPAEAARTNTAAPPRDAFVQAPARKAGPELAPTATPPPSTLLTEDIRDAQANCLDQVGDWLGRATPQLRARAEVLLLRDTRPGAEGRTGHAVIRQGSGIFDPSTGRSYPSFEAFNAEGRYSLAGTVGGAAMHRVLSTPAGSTEREAAIARAGISPALASLLVADATPTVPTGQAWSLLTEGYRQSPTLEGAVTYALERASGNPSLQAELIALLQTLPPDALQENHDYGVQDMAIAPGQRPPPPESFSSVSATRTGGSALDVVARQLPADLLLPALDAAVQQGRFAAADRDVYALYLGPTGAATDATLDTAVAEVQAAQAAYTRALEQRAALDQQLAADLALYGPYLTDAQRAEYIQEFREYHSSDYDAVNVSADALHGALTDNAALLEQALRGPEGMTHAEAVFGAWSALAQSPHADEALAWAARAEAPGSAFAPHLGSFDVGALTQSAMAGSVASYLAQHPEAPPEQAVDHLQNVLTTAYLGQQGGAAAIDLGTNNLPAAVRTGLAGLRQMVGGDIQGGMTVLRGLEAGSSKWAGGFAAVGFIIGLVQTAESAEEGDALGTAWGAAFTGQQFSSALSTGLSAMNRAGGAALAGRVAGGFGAVAAALDIFIQLGEIHSGDGNVGTGLSIAGDVAGLVGGALIATGATGVGVPLAAVGAAVYVIGELVSAVILANEESERQAQLLRDQREILGAIEGVDADELMAVAHNVVSPNVMLPHPPYPGIIGLLAMHGADDPPILLNRSNGDQLVFTRVGADNRIHYRDPWTGEEGSMSQEEFFQFITGVHVHPSEYEAAVEPFRPQTPVPEQNSASPTATATPGANTSSGSSGGGAYVPPEVTPIPNPMPPGS